MRLTFTVTDSGIGIAAADLKRLFRPFAQASDDVARRYGGAGLGLVFVKRIAKAMGGDLTVTSKPGRGSTFRLTRGGRRAPRPRRAGARAGGKPSRGLRVLCVEDNPYGRVVLNAVLRELGHRVELRRQRRGGGRGGGARRARCRADGRGAAGHRRHRGDAAHPRAAARRPAASRSSACRAAPSRDDAAAAQAAGMNAYLRKPASPAELNEALRTAAGVKRV